MVFNVLNNKVQGCYLLCLSGNIIEFCCVSTPSYTQRCIKAHPNRLNASPGKPSAKSCLHTHSYHIGSFTLFLSSPIPWFTTADPNYHARLSFLGHHVVTLQCTSSSYRVFEPEPWPPPILEHPHSYRRARSLSMWVMVKVYILSQTLVFYVTFLLNKKDVLKKIITKGYYSFTGFNSTILFFPWE